MRYPSDGISVDGMCETTRMPLEVFETLMRRPAWHGRANCLGLGSTINFFPERGESTEAAKALCCDCPVIDECATAGAREKHGVWAGQSERGRRAARRAAA